MKSHAAWCLLQQRESWRLDAAHIKEHAITLLTKTTKAQAAIIAGLVMLLPTGTLAQDGPACAVLRAADLTRVLPGDIGYNSFTSNEVNFRISNCNAIGANASVSLRMISFLLLPNGSDADFREMLLDRYDPNIPFLTGETVTDTAVSYAAEGDLIFWNSDSTVMYIVDEAPGDMERTRAIARLIAEPLGLANEPASVFE